MLADPAARLARLDRTAAHLAARSTRLSRTRLAVALAGVIGALVVGEMHGAAWGWVVGLVALVAFLALARVHERVERARTRLARWRGLHEREIARRRLDWDALGAPPASAPPDHPFASDLDLVGPRSVLHLVDTTATETGHARLRDCLLETAPDPATIRRRQDAVRALVGRPHRRDRLALDGWEAGQPPTGVPRADTPRWSDAPLRAWLGGAPADATLRAWAWGLSALAALTAVLAVVRLAGGPGGWTLSFFVYLVLYISRYRSFATVFDRAYDLQRAVREVEPALTRLERDAARARPGDPLGDVWTPFQGEARPSAFYARLRGIASAAAVTRNDVARVVVNALLPYDLLLTMALDRLRERLRGVMPRWLDAYAEAEALAALAGIASRDPDGTTFPTLLDATDDGPLVEAEALGHPLLGPREGVRNPAVLDTGEVVILTGSNMAGKSTYLRSVGVAAAMAWAGAPVAAARLRVAPVRVVTSMRVGDALQEGVSTFYAEVRRLRRLLDTVESDGPAALVLIDEMYRGTNNRERLAGARALVRALAGARVASLVATHDLALTRLADEVAAVRNAHFRERVEADRLAFDYRLREGPCPTTNALAIMSRAGLPVEAPDDEAG